MPFISSISDSWIGVIWDYIWRPEVGPYNRVKRKLDVKAGHKLDSKSKGD